jgi:hypothetical protein
VVAAPNLKIQRPAKPVLETEMDCIEVTPKSIKEWRLPSFQRPLTQNDKLDELAQEIAENGGVISGVITIGLLDGREWLVDGQHRREAFLRSGATTGYCDIRKIHFEDVASMAREFMRLNSSIARMRPDDHLRALEQVYEPLRRVRKACPFVGYDNVRRNERSALVSMSAVIRCWTGAATEVPKGGTAPAADLAAAFSTDDADSLIAFLDCIHQAWGADANTGRLWAGLNLTLCMWMYRRLVVTRWSAKTPIVTRETFTKCMMSVGAAAVYVDWLMGRGLNKHSTAPAYKRVKGLIAARLEEELGKKVSLPQPPWAS